MLASYSNTAFTPDRLVISLDDEVSRKIVLAVGQKCLRGALLGMITVGGKYIVSLLAAADGSQIPDCILAEDADATTADVNTVAYFRGQFNDAAVIYGVGQTVALVREGLRGKGIDLIAVMAP